MFLRPPSRIPRRVPGRCGTRSIMWACLEMQHELFSLMQSTNFGRLLSICGNSGALNATASSCGSRWRSKSWSCAQDVFSLFRNNCAHLLLGPLLSKRGLKCICCTQPRSNVHLEHADVLHAKLLEEGFHVGDASKIQDLIVISLAVLFFSILENGII